MPWLRIDDGFASHPKIAALSDREFRCWMRTLCYCARYKTDGIVTKTASKELPDFAKNRAKFEAIGLLERDENGDLSIHDWATYNPPDPTHAARQARYRRRQRDGESDDTDRHTKRHGDGASRIGTRARPVPSPIEELPQPDQRLLEDADLDLLPVHTELAQAQEAAAEETMAG